MKVLKKGTPQKGWAKEFSCTGNGNGGGGCKAKLLVEQDDVFKTYSHHYDGSSETYNTFKCSECSVLTDIKEHLPFTPRSPRKSDSGATYTGSAGAGVKDDDD